MGCGCRFYSRFVFEYDSQTGPTVVLETANQVLFFSGLCLLFFSTHVSPVFREIVPVVRDKSDLALKGPLRRKRREKVNKGKSVIGPFINLQEQMFRVEVDPGACPGNTGPDAGIHPGSKKINK